MRFKCLCVLILGLSAMVLGASEGRAGEPQDVFAGDKRLSRPVTLEARHLPLDEVLAQTSELTGVAVKAEGDAADLRA
ncbi:MAG TPA: hypothetical protein VK689_02865, partial [Armatimonadota bacterium]|nr:hypothetical protein [Armatimonadota bacterium]